MVLYSNTYVDFPLGSSLTFSPPLLPRLLLTLLLLLPSSILSCVFHPQLSARLTKVHVTTRVKNSVRSFFLVEKLFLHAPGLAPSAHPELSLTRHVPSLSLLFVYPLPLLHFSQRCILTSRRINTAPFSSSFRAAKAALSFSLPPSPSLSFLRPLLFNLVRPKFHRDNPDKPITGNPFTGPCSSSFGQEQFLRLLQDHWVVVSSLQPKRLVRPTLAFLHRSTFANLNPCSLKYALPVFLGSLGVSFERRSLSFCLSCGFLSPPFKI